MVGVFRKMLNTLDVGILFSVLVNMMLLSLDSSLDLKFECAKIAQEEFLSIT